MKNNKNNHKLILKINKWNKKYNKKKYYLRIKIIKLLKVNKII